VPEAAQRSVETCSAGRAGARPCRAVWTMAHVSCHPTPGARPLSVRFVVKLAKFVLVFCSGFPGGSRSGFPEKSLARNRKTNIVHAPPRLAEMREVLPERLF
jgi:hypothetical protein